MFTLITILHFILGALQQSNAPKKSNCKAQFKTFAKKQVHYSDSLKYYIIDSEFKTQLKSKTFYCNLNLDSNQIKKLIGKKIYKREKGYSGISNKTDTKFTFYYMLSKTIEQQKIEHPNNKQYQESYLIIYFNKNNKASQAYIDYAKEETTFD